MPSLIDIRRRIRSVKNTQQITKAMKMVSAAKLRRAQDRVIAARPYADSMRRDAGECRRRGAAPTEAAEPAAGAASEEKRIQMIVVTADRGLAGGFNANVIRAAQKFIAGAPGRRRSSSKLSAAKAAISSASAARTSPASTSLCSRSRCSYEDAQEIARKVIERFRKGEIDAVYLVVQPIQERDGAACSRSRGCCRSRLPKSSRSTIDYIYEQPPGELLAALLPRYVEVQIYRAMLESLGGRTCRAHDRDGSRQQERRRRDRQTDAEHEPRAAGQHHATKLSKL